MSELSLYHIDQTLQQLLDYHAERMADMVEPPDAEEQDPTNKARTLPVRDLSGPKGEGVPVRYATRARPCCANGLRLAAARTVGRFPSALGPAEQTPQGGW